MSFAEDFRNVFFRNGNGLTRIVVINAIVYIAANIIDEVLAVSGVRFSLVYFLALPGEIVLAATHAWSFVTYMFLHRDFFHILFNMLWLYWIGRIFVEYAGSRRLVSVYLLGGLCGGVLFIMAAAIAPHAFSRSILLGASAGVMAVVVSTAVLLPDYVIRLLFFGGVRLKYLALVSFLLTSVIDISQNTGGKISHIGGALFGLFFMLQYKRGNDITKILADSLDRISSLFSRKSKIKITYSRSKSDEEYNERNRQKQEKVDRILDKISKSGYEALTKEEKDFLFKASGKN